MQVSRLISVVALASCAGTFGGPPRAPTPLQHVDRILFAAAVLSLACDWGSTRRAAVDHWTYGVEANGMLGANPSIGRVDAYMSTIMVGTVVLGLVLPEGVRTAFLGAVAGVEIESVAWNYGTVPGACGLPGSSVR